MIEAPLPFLTASQHLQVCLKMFQFLFLPSTIHYLLPKAYLVFQSKKMNATWHLWALTDFGLRCVFKHGQYKGVPSEDRVILQVTRNSAVQTNSKQRFVGGIRARLDITKVHNKEGKEMRAAQHNCLIIPQRSATLARYLIKWKQKKLNPQHNSTAF